MEMEQTVSRKNIRLTVFSCTEINNIFQEWPKLLKLLQIYSILLNKLFQTLDILEQIVSMLSMSGLRVMCGRFLTQGVPCS